MNEKENWDIKVTIMGKKYPLSSERYSNVIESHKGTSKNLPLTLSPLGEGRGEAIKRGVFGSSHKPSRLKLTKKEIGDIAALMEDKAVPILPPISLDIWLALTPAAHMEFVKQFPSPINIYPEKDILDFVDKMGWRTEQISRFTIIITDKHP